MGRWMAYLVAANMPIPVTGAPHGQAVEPKASTLKSHNDSILIRHFSPTAPAAKPIGALLVPGWPAAGKEP